MTMDMQTSEETRTCAYLNFLAGVGLGALLGASAALLLAPQPGKQTQETVREAAQRLKERTAEAAGRLKEHSTELLAQKKQLLAEAISAGRAAAAEKRQELERRQARPTPEAPAQEGPK